MVVEQEDGGGRPAAPGEAEDLRQQLAGLRHHVAALEETTLDLMRRGDLDSLLEAILGRAGELERVEAAVAQKGYTCVALALYWSKHLIKCEIALGKGKKEFDKRDTMRERDSNRELQRAVRNKGKEE